MRVQVKNKRSSQTKLRVNALSAQFRKVTDAGRTYQQGYASFNDTLLKVYSLGMSAGYDLARRDFVRYGK